MKKIKSIIKIAWKMSTCNIHFTRFINTKNAILLLLLDCFFFLFLQENLTQFKNSMDIFSKQIQS